MKNKTYDIGIFLDIEGAFDNTPFKDTYEEAKKHGTDPLIVWWIKTLLEDRIITGKLRNTKVEVKTVYGCSKGKG